jgi:hypothetical protein
MTDDRLLRDLNDMLDGLPKVAPDRLLVSVLDGVQTSVQSRRRTSMYDWRRLVSNLAKPQLAVGAALIVVLGLIAINQIDRSPGSTGAGGSPSPSPSPVPSASAVASPMPSPSERARRAGDYQEMSPPGRYAMPEPNTDGVGAWPTDEVIVTVPGGWTQNGQWRGGGIVKPRNPEAIARVTFGRLGALLPAPIDCPVKFRSSGVTVGDLTARLDSLAEVDIADVTIGRHVGKRVEFTIADPQPKCDGLFGWTTPDGGEQWNYHWLPGWHHQLSILDVDGTRFLIDASYKVDAPAEVIAEVRAIADSVELD